MMVNWRDFVLEKIGTEKQGVTKQALLNIARKGGKVEKKTVNAFIDSLVEWEVVEEYKSKSQRKYRLKKPDAKRKSGEKPIIVFGSQIPTARIRNAAKDALNCKTISTDDIFVKDYLQEDEENLMIKIAILDHIEEELKAIHHEFKITRKNKLTIVID
ncbi:MAG: hypothetical protein ABH851_05965 [Methanobacteriota archaeon]